MKTTGYILIYISSLMFMTSLWADESLVTKYQGGVHLHADTKVHLRVKRPDGNERYRLMPRRVKVNGKSCTFELNRSSISKRNGTRVLNGKLPQRGKAEYALTAWLEGEQLRYGVKSVKGENLKPLKGSFGSAKNDTLFSMFKNASVSNEKDQENRRLRLQATLVKMGCSNLLTAKVKPLVKKLKVHQKEVLPWRTEVHYNRPKSTVTD